MCHTQQGHVNARGPQVVVLGAGVAGGDLEASAWWLLQRVQLLEQLDGLETFMVLTEK